MLRIAILFLSALSFTACAIGPMQSGRSARSLGEGEWGAGAGLLPTLSAEASYGVTQDLDVGAMLEYQFGFLASGFAKYSFINKDQGFSLAGYAGAFAGATLGDSTGFFVGPVVSYKHKWFEPYLIVRYTYVDWRAGDLTQEEREDSILDMVSWSNTSLYYLQTDLGVNFWVGNNFAITPSAKIFTFFEDVSGETSVIPGLSFTFLFL